MLIESYLCTKLILNLIIVHRVPSHNVRKKIDILLKIGEGVNDCAPNSLTEESRNCSFICQIGLII